MKVLFLTMHVLAAMVCFSASHPTADLDWKKWPCEKQNERQSELTQPPQRRFPVQFVYTPYTHQPYMSVSYPLKAYVHHSYFSRLAWQKPYFSYIPLLHSIYTWPVLSRNPHSTITFTPPEYTQPPTNPTNNPTTPIQTTTIPITNTMATTVTPTASSTFVTTEYSTTTTIPTSPTPAQEA
ncbi:opiorphin prepropeptide [Sarcophilus harrisii]|uniref:Kappa-casein n=1 Tax=Sarcophilus harrisii TaxID=9305 RepID=G3VI25_SARHA